MTKAIKSDVAGVEPKTVYRDCTVEEQEHPADPNVKLRRTVIDEVMVMPVKRDSGIKE